MSIPTQDRRPDAPGALALINQHIGTEPLTLNPLFAFPLHLINRLLAISYLHLSRAVFAAMDPAYMEKSEWRLSFHFVRVFNFSCRDC